MMDKIKSIIKKTYKPIIAVLLIVVVLSISLYSCSHNEQTTDKGNTDLTQETQQQEATPADESSSSTEATSYDDENSLESTVEAEIEAGDIDDVYSVVCSAVEYKLSDAGFICEPGVAMTLDDESYEAVGTYYYKDELNLFKTDDIKSVGFIEVVRDDRDFKELSNEDSVILVEPLSGDDPTDLVCAYNYNDIGSSHFVYNDKYVVYYQQTPMRVVYSVHENDAAEYDLAIGSLYDYDKGMFLYDETIFDEYRTHSGVELFSDEDYKELEESLKEMSRQQLIAGYTVTQYDVVYISPEQVQAYLDGEEEDAFFGYSVSDLTETMGIGTALEYTEDGLKPANLGGDLSNYNWKSFLTKVGIGCGIIIVGAVLAPLTGGTSIACALITMTKITVTASLCAGLGTMAIETAKGMIEGKSFSEALHGCTYKGLDTFANTFLITAAISAVGVNTGLIKPTACFVAGTEIAVVDSCGNAVHKPIETIVVGDNVLSRAEDGKISYKEVTETFIRSSDSIIALTINGASIETTQEHPFYDPDLNTWVAAGDLGVGDNVLLSDGTCVAVTDAELIHNADDVLVYNFTVADNHTYYVGESEVLVHNKCNRITNLRNRGVKNAWKEEVKAVQNGTSRYNWTPEQIKELLETGKVAGYDGHHIIPVSQLKDTAAEYLISSADDIALIPKDVHVLVHAGGNAAGDMEVLVQCVPWVEEHMVYLLSLVG